jgi:hypothetical protein
MTFFLRDGWQVQFCESDLKTPLPRCFGFRDREEIRELASLMPIDEIANRVGYDLGLPPKCVPHQSVVRLTDVLIPIPLIFFLQRCSQYELERLPTRQNSKLCVGYW